jgi:hypothetical protein
MGPEMRRVESFVASDKLYCVFIAPNEGAIRKHAQRGGFPASRFSAVTGMIDPATAESSETKKRPDTPLAGRQRVDAKLRCLTSGAGLINPKPFRTRP